MPQSRGCGTGSGRGLKISRRYCAADFSKETLKSMGRASFSLVVLQVIKDKVEVTNVDLITKSSTVYHTSNMQNKSTSLPSDLN